MKTKLDMTPSTSTIRSWREDTRVKLDAVIKELVDNSFDANASEVWLTAWDTSIQVSDNGRGIRNISKALKFGESDGDHKRLGRFGIALKRGPARLARLLKISTRNAHATINVEVDWKALERSGDWTSVEADERPTTRGQTYTEIELLGLYPYRIMGWGDLPAKLSATFAPALRDGRKITFDGEPLSAPPEPLLEEVIDEAGTAGGRLFVVRAGLRPEGEDGPMGVSVAYLHRVITEGWIPKFLQRCNLRRFCAEVILVDDETDGEDGKWKLNNFKDDIDEEQQAELDAALELILKALIERLKDEAHNLRLRTLEKQIAQFIVGPGKDPYREPATVSGDPLKPIHGLKHGRRIKRRRRLFAKRSGERVASGGEAKPSYAEKSFSLEFQDLPTVRTVVFMPPATPSLRLIINTAHPYGAELFAQFNRNETGQIIATALWSLASYMTSQPDYQKRYPYLLNGTEDIFVATNMNVSRWFELGAAV